MFLMTLTILRNFCGMFFTWHVTTFYVFLIIRLGLWAPLWLSWKRSTFSEEDLSSFPGLGRSPGEGKGYPLQYSGLKNAMDHLVHGVIPLVDAKLVTYTAINCITDTEEKGGGGALID